MSEEERRAQMVALLGFDPFDIEGQLEDIKERVATDLLSGSATGNPPPPEVLVLLASIVQRAALEGCRMGLLAAHASVIVRELNHIEEMPDMGRAE